MVQKNPSKQSQQFCGSIPTESCRVCGGLLSDNYVDSGSGIYQTRWVRCSVCGSWSIAYQPDQDMLDIFYSDYLLHTRLSAVNPANNDGRRYTHEYRELRESEYKLGINDVLLELKSGCNLLDFGSQDSVFLDVCRELQPNLGRTVAMDYGIEAREDNRHVFKPIEEFYSGNEDFDIVTLWDVYEHIPNLEKFMLTLSRKIKTGSSVLIQTPRSDFYGDALGALWHHFLPVQHLQLPSRLGISMHFKSYGFDLAKAASFGANAPNNIIPDSYKSLYDKLVKHGDMGSTQVLLFRKN